MSLKALKSLLGERRGRAQLAGGERGERPAGRFDDFGDPLEPRLERHRIGKAHALDGKTRESGDTAGILADAWHEMIAAIRRLNSLDHGTPLD